MNTTDRYTRLQFTLRLWSRLNRRTVNGAHPQWNNRGNRAYVEKGIELRISLGHLLVFIEDNWQIIRSIWDAGEQPSIDRIESDGHYELGNVRIIPLSVNARRRADDLHPKILAAIQEANGNRTRAAKLVGVSIRTIQRHMNTTG